MGVAPSDQGEQVSEAVTVWGMRKKCFPKPIRRFGDHRELSHLQGPGNTILAHIWSLHNSTVFSDLRRLPARFYCSPFLTLLQSYKCTFGHLRLLAVPCKRCAATRNCE